MRREPVKCVRNMTGVKVLKKCPGGRVRTISVDRFFNEMGSAEERVVAPKVIDMVKEFGVPLTVGTGPKGGLRYRVCRRA